MNYKLVNAEGFNIHKGNDSIDVYDMLKNGNLLKDQNGDTYTIEVYKDTDSGNYNFSVFPSDDFMNYAYLDLPIGSNEFVYILTSQTIPDYENLSFLTEKDTAFWGISSVVNTVAIPEGKFITLTNIDGNSAFNPYQNQEFTLSDSTVNTGRLQRHMIRFPGGIETFTSFTWPSGLLWKDGNEFDASAYNAMTSGQDAIVTIIDKTYASYDVYGSSAS